MFFLNIVSVEPVQIIQIITFYNDNQPYIDFIYNSNDSFIFTSIGD